MSWYTATPGTVTYTKRAAISVDCTGGGGSVDVTVDVPANWDDFWTSILANGYDIVVTAADGTTLVTFERESYTYATRALTLEIDNVTLTAGRVCLLWVYYGYSGETTDRSTTVTPSSAKIGYIELSAPNRLMFQYTPDQWSASRPRSQVVKKSTETIDIAVGGWPLRKRRDDAQYALSLFAEEVKEANVAVYSGATDVTSAYDETKTRIVYNQGDPIVFARMDAGTDATDYTIRVTVTTTLGQVYEWRGWLAVRDTDEA